MDKIDHLMAENNENNKDSQKGQVAPNKYLKKVGGGNIRPTGHVMAREEQIFSFIIAFLTGIWPAPLGGGCVKDFVATVPKP